MPRHVALIRKAGVLRHCRHRPAALAAHQLLRAVHAQADEVVVRRMAGRGLELPREMERAQPRGVCEFFERERIRHAAAHQLHRAQHGDGRRDIRGLARGELLVFAQQMHGDGPRDALRHGEGARRRVQLARDGAHEHACGMMRGQLAHIRRAVQSGTSAEFRRDALKEPRLESEHQDLHLARPPERHRPARGRHAPFARAIDDLFYLAIHDHIAAQRLEKIIEHVLPDARRIIHMPRAPAPLLQEKPRPPLRTPHHRDRRRHILLDIHERKRGGHFHEGRDDRQRARESQPQIGCRLGFVDRRAWCLFMAS